MSNADRLLEMADESLELLSNRIAAAGIVWLVDLFPPRKSSPTTHREVYAVVRSAVFEQSMLSLSARVAASLRCWQ